MVIIINLKYVLNDIFSGKYTQISYVFEGFGILFQHAM